MGRREASSTFIFMSSSNTMLLEPCKTIAIASDGEDQVGDRRGKRSVTGTEGGRVVVIMRVLMVGGEP